MMKWISAAGLCVLASVAVTAQSGGSTAQKPTTPAQKEAASTSKQAPDAMFMRQAAMSSMAEIEHGRVAAKNATNDAVKQFAERMVDDHTKANDELKGLASQKNVTLPAELDQKHRAMHQKLSKMEGAAFDKAYMSHMVMSHTEAVGLYQRESKTGKDADAKAWAAKILPTLQEHLKMARDLNTKAGAGTTKK